MYLAEFIHSFRHKDREDYEPSGFTCLVSSHERCFDIFSSCQCVALFLLRREIYMVCIFHDRFINR